MVCTKGYLRRRCQKHSNLSSGKQKKGNALGPLGASASVPSSGLVYKTGCELSVSPSPSGQQQEGLAGRRKQESPALDIVQFYMHMYMYVVYEIYKDLLTCDFSYHITFSLSERESKRDGCAACAED